MMNIYEFKLEVTMRLIKIFLCGLLLFAYPAMAADNVVIHFNYPLDTIYIGQTNVLEVWLENDEDLDGMALGFEFGNYVGAIVWNSTYGNYPPINQENDAVDVFIFNVNTYNMYDPILPDSILFGGTYIPPIIPGLPANSLRKCYTLSFDVPTGEPEGSLCVDNIFIPPAGGWIFALPTGSIAPNYHGCVNSSYEDPDCPAICFPVVEKDFVCGDANGDGAVNVADLVWIINYVFTGGPPSDPDLAADASCNGRVNIGDAGYLMDYIFLGGDQPCANCPKY
jgi:hypothetical protein